MGESMDAVIAASKLERLAEQASRRERLRQLTQRLNDLKARGLIITAWFTEHHVRVSTPARPELKIDFWPSTAAFRLVGTSERGGRGWEPFLSALGIEGHIGAGDL